MPLQKGGEAAVQANIHELAHHGTRPRSHAQIVAIAEHAAKNDDHGHKGHEGHDHVILRNAHPHAAPSHPQIMQEGVDVNPGKKSYNKANNAIVSGTPHGQYDHHIHDRRDKGPEHHPPHGLMEHEVNGGY